MNFCDLTIHQKITLRGNLVISNGRQFLASWYNYHSYPVIYERKWQRVGNLPEIEHRNINKGGKSYDTLFWLYGTPVGQKGRRETAGPYGFGGVPWWRLPVMAIKRRKARAIKQPQLF